MLDNRTLSNFDNLGDNYAVIILETGIDKETDNIEVVKKLMGKKTNCLFVTVNEPYNKVVKLMKKSNVDTSRVLFIDCITKTGGGNITESPNCIYLDSPSNLTELSISISEALESMGENKFLFVDALSTLIIYNKPQSFAKFAHFAMTKAKTSETLGIFVMVDGEIEKNVFTQVEQFSDKIIDLK